MKILVTGANGYIGSKVVEHLCDNGVEVIACDILSNHIDSRATFVCANIFEVRNDWFDFFEKPDVCLHLAWRDGFKHNSELNIADISFHFLFLKSLIDSGIRRIVSMGSMHEIGYWEGAIDENTPCNPQTLYGIAKNALRSSLELYCKSKHCQFQWLRGFYIYGDDSYGNSIFCKIRKAVENGESSFPITSGLNKYDFLSVDELSTQISLAVQQDKVLGVINCCSGIPVSLREQLEWYIKENGLNIKLDYGKYPDRPYDSPCIYGDNQRIKRILNLYKNVLVTGANGQLGFDCIRELKRRGYFNVRGVDIDDLDISDKDAVNSFFDTYRPDIVFHNAAWTAVDKAEDNPDLVYSINSLGTKYIAEACSKVGAKLVYISTDYVFDGNGEEPFEIDSVRKGLSVYGRTKSIAEDFVKDATPSHFIVRISWAFGVNGNNFVKTMLKLAKSGKKEISVVSDQIGSVTYTKDLAVLLCDMIETEKFGTYHATNEGYISWADFAEEIFKMTDLNVKVKRVSTEEYKRIVGTQANRPKNSRLSKKILDVMGFSRLPPWKSALERFLKELNVNEDSRN